MDRRINNAVSKINKRHILVLCLTLCLLLIRPCGQAAVLAASTDNVKDDLEYLTSDELDQIQSKIELAVSEYKLDIVIVITDDIEDKSSMEYADDYYDYNGFGVGSDDSGLLMLINMYDSEIWISTCGEAIQIFTDDRIESVLDEVVPYLSEENFYQASMVFISQVEQYAKLGPPAYAEVPDTLPDYQYPDEEDPYYDDVISPSYWEKALIIMSSPWAYLLGLIAGVIGVVTASMGNMGKVTINNQTYEENGSFHLIERQDNFINQTVTRTYIPKNNSNSNSSSGGGHSSVHTSSSGQSHGGGGRSF